MAAFRPRQRPGWVSGVGVVAAGPVEVGGGGGLGGAEGTGELSSGLQRTVAMQVVHHLAGRATRPPLRRS